MKKFLLIGAKKYRGFYTYAGLFLVAFLLATVFFALNKSSSQAACSPFGAAYGKVDMQFITPASVNTTQKYVLWTRLSIASASANSILVSVDGGTCYAVGGSNNIPLNTLTWVNYANGQTGTPITLSLSPGKHSIDFYGDNAGVAIDKVLMLTDASCTPAGNGSNCESVPGLTGTISSPAKDSTVSGVVPINVTTNNVSGSVKKAVFIHGFTPIATTYPNSNSFSYNWDTTDLKNGTYSIWVELFDESGNSTITPVVNINVRNTLTAKLLAPSNNATVKGTVPVWVNVKHANHSISKIVLCYGYVICFANIQTSPPHIYEWDTTKIKNGNWPLYAVVTDGSGKSFVTPVIHVNVSN